MGNHNDLNNIQGGSALERYHLTFAQYTNLSNGQQTITYRSTDPTPSDITAGSAAMYKNTTTGIIRLWANDFGTMRSVALV